MTPTEIITGSIPCNIVYGRTQAAEKIIAALREAGWIIVRHDAIKLAQAHARDEVQERPTSRSKSYFGQGTGGVF